ncbi:hypothetical protein Q7P37_002469 [Cladosporium fusiforme]
MPSDLPALPIELVERVVAYLDTKEVGAIRLTCRELRDKASQGSYLVLFTHRTVDLTEPSLTSLTNALQADIPLARKLRELTLTAVCFDPSQGDGQRPAYFDDSYRPPFQAMLHKETCRSRKKFTKSDKRFSTRLELATLRLQQAQHHWNVEKGLYPELLSSAFKTIKEKSVGGELACLRLTAAVVTSTTSRFTPDAHDYKLTSSEESFLLATSLDALVSTNLTVKSLDVFSKARLCGVPCAELAAYLTHKPIARLRPLGAAITQFSLRYSRIPINTGRSSTTSDTHCCNCNTRRYRQPAAENLCHVHRCVFGDEDELSCTFESSLGKFLSLLPNLTSLHLHECETRWHDNEADPNTAAFTHLARTAHFPSLRSLALHGTNLTETSLLSLLRKLPTLQTLHLEHVNLAEGVWSKILSFLRQQEKDKDKDKDKKSSSSSSSSSSREPPPPLTLLSLKDVFEHKRADALNPSLTSTTTIGLGTTTLHHHAPPPPPVFPPPPPPRPSPRTRKRKPTSTRSSRSACPKPPPRSAFSAEVAYGFVGAGARGKVEFRWDRERCREFGPVGADGFDGF